MTRMSSLLDYIPKDKEKEKLISIRVVVRPEVHKDMSYLLERRNLTWQKFLTAAIEAGRDELRQRK
jgi:hypothetical protein